jgi:hypothetical protein
MDFSFSSKIAVCLLVCSFAAGAAFAGPLQSVDDSGLDLKSIPIAEWLNVGDHAQIPWNLQMGDPYLRVDQRLEVAYAARLAARDLNRAGASHDLFLISRISSPDGEWIGEFHVVHREIEQELPKGTQAAFFLRVCVQPGEYLLWLMLYDRESGKHNVAKRRLRVPELRGDPLPDLYRRMPLVEFPEIEESDENGPGYLKGQLNLPVHNKSALDVALVSTLSPPEQWAGRNRVLRTQSDVTIGALAALSQLQLDEGTVSITGLDLTRRQVLFEQPSAHHVDWLSLTGALKKAQSPELSASQLQGSKNNGAFFRDFLNQRITTERPAESLIRVIIVVTSSLLFERGSDLTPLQIEGDCRCRVYHLRFRLNMTDVFDELEKILKPAHPRTFNVMTPRDLRKAIAEIVSDLGKL